jgi:hypothetical protein
MAVKDASTHTKAAKPTSRRSCSVAMQLYIFSIWKYRNECPLREM